ncbi:hypothetical protein BX600DRAFT_514136 [Xylariales sp. PMI_506]|nr:hypothetical protein BX600DRAFT_514136 [Xylariales sp. PMI_506]
MDWLIPRIVTNASIDSSFTPYAGISANASLFTFTQPPPTMSWRVTPDNPVRYPNRLDVERCAALHNEILWHGWVDPGRDPADFVGVSWNAFHGDAAAAIAPRLQPDLAAFLDRAVVPAGGEQHQSFNYLVSGLQWPGGMWFNHEGFAVDGDPDRFLTLYSVHSIASHPDGLVFDQVENKAIVRMSIFDLDINGDEKWYHLEEILTAWLDMIDVGKMQAVAENVKLENEKFDPWVFVPYSELQLARTVLAFNRLATAIESRMPKIKDSSGAQRVLSDDDDDDDAFEPLLSEEDLDYALTPHGFARAFLSRSRRPKFRYIAPGLSLPTRESMKVQPFASIKRSDLRPDPLGEERDEDPWHPLEMPPLLLFRSTKKYESWKVPYITGSPQDPPFYWPYNGVETFPAGLYMNDVNRQSVIVFEDSVKLVLPYPIGGFGYARTADGSRFGARHFMDGDQRGHDRFAELFQLGYNPFGEMHNVQLEKVLIAWRELVESGEWKIGKEGVKDSIDKWKEADRGDKWQKYTVPVGW